MRQLNEQEMQLCIQIDSLKYHLQESASTLKCLQGRIFEEWIQEKPFPKYGNPPKVLSEPLALSQAQQIFDSQLLWVKSVIQGYAIIK